MMWFEKRGIVAKISGNNCIILSPEGTYSKIPLPSKDTRVGSEVFYRNTHLAYPFKPLLMVASFLIMLMCYPLLDQFILPQAVAYVSLDINPSLEMSVDKHMRVTDVQCFDDDATNLVKQLNLKGKGLNDAVTEVINQAIEQNYIKAGQENLMLSTVSPSGKVPAPIDQAALCQVLENSIASRGYTGQVKVYATSDEFHKASEANKLSAGKYLIYEQLIKSGNNVSVDDINRQPVSQLAASYNLDLLPNYEKIMIQTAQTNQDTEITVDNNGQRVSIEEYIKSHDSMSYVGEVHNNQPDTNVSRSYPARKSRITQTIPAVSMNITPEVPENNNNKSDKEHKAVEIAKSIASKIKNARI